MFNENQNKELSKKLDPKHVKSRSQAGFNLSYIEGWHVIAEMNRIFGFDGWSRETEYCHKICEYEYGSKHKVGYEAKVVITVGDVSREGTGLGSGISKDIFDAHEGAAKEAETDAMKRALMTFGNVFGLALYDKAQANVGVEMTDDDKADYFIKMINKEKDLDALCKWFTSDVVVSKVNTLPEELKNKVCSTYFEAIEG